MNTLSPEVVRTAALQSTQPLILRGFVRDWELVSKSLDDWSTGFGDRKVSWRTGPCSRVSDEPCWERGCGRRELTFHEFMKKALTHGDQWMYFDYKHLNECFSSDSDIFKTVSWAKFGFPEKTGADSTLWIGSRGAHTPAHQDTYGSNIVAQILGSKHWILFPPETNGLRPTRVPYEESSVYSELNFSSPKNLDPFRGLSGGCSVVLEAGDALLVPRGWWHHVQNVSTVAVTLNVWLPHENDGAARVSEALVRIMVAQLCKDLPPDTTRLLLNPNEDDLADTPLAVLFLQLDTVTRTHLNERRKHRRLKRQKTTEETVNNDRPDFNMADFLTNPGVSTVPAVTSEQLLELLKTDVDLDNGNDETDGDALTSSLTLTRAVINAYCQRDVIEAVKSNLLTSLS